MREDLERLLRETTLTTVAFAIALGVDDRPHVLHYDAAEVVLACPVLEADADAALGAAAATIACERISVHLGGLHAHTLVPAELLNLPSEPTDDFPDAPYPDPIARERSIEAARSRCGSPSIKSASPPSTPSGWSSCCRGFCRSW